MLKQEDNIGEKARNLMSKRPSSLLRMGTFFVMVFLSSAITFLWNRPHQRTVQVPLSIIQIDSAFVAYGGMLRNTTISIPKEQEVVLETVSKEGPRHYCGRIQHVLMREDSVFFTILLNDVNNVPIGEIMSSVALPLAYSHGMDAHDAVRTSECAPDHP